jgi:la-related protein 1
MPAPAMYAPAPDMAAMYGYPHMPQAPMTAVPYQPYMEQFSLMSMLSMQLYVLVLSLPPFLLLPVTEPNFYCAPLSREYYFSVDNLCKDLFLRKHMDSQGFVLLNVIANFKRIKSLTEDIELLRHVCRQLKAVEYRPGEDGFDRLRKRDKWEQWVLSMEMRDPSAQHDGPAAPTANFAPDFSQENYMISPQREAPVHKWVPP